MAQLRDAQTSELIADGTPLEVALVARELGAAEVLFDDVGAGFNPAAVIAAHEENLDGLAGAAAAASAGAEREAILAAATNAREDEEHATGELAQEAGALLEAARERVG